MPINNTLSVCQKHLFSDIDKMQSDKVPQIIQHRILRIRDIYEVWLQYPSKREVELVHILMDKYQISRMQAYDDMKLTKILLGDINQTSKQFHRWRFNNMIMKAIETAERRKDMKAMVAALDKYARYNKLDKDDETENPFEDIVIQPFEPTENPEIIGIKRIPNIKQKISQKLKQYLNDDIVDVQYEEADFGADKLFNK